MLVAFEAGGLLRAILLFMLYPFICLVSEETGLKIMVMVCFFGIKRSSFRAGAAVLPKFFLEEVGLEGFEVVRRYKRKVGVTDLPLVMVESFLRDYMEVDSVIGRDLKVFSGYFLGLMEDKKKRDVSALADIFEEDNMGNHYIGLTSFKRSLDHQVFSRCTEIYLVSEADRRNWHQLPMNRYPKPLIFHDGRLAFKPTPLATLAMLTWLPFGFFLAIIRIILALSLPHSISIPILTFSGLHLRIIEQPTCSSSQSVDDDHHNKSKGVLYVCNHRTLLDPLYLSFGLKKQLTAVTYSLSRMSEILAPIRTVRLTRERDRDGKMMEKLLSQGDLVVCPEGTTCREPYLLRFSPLFAEMSEEIVPVAMDAQVNMFYGTTAGGFKCLDPIFFLMNPYPAYKVQLLEKVTGLSTSRDEEGSKFDVANHVQGQLGKALGFECTRLTRKDKYLTLAGNEGIVPNERTNHKKRL